MEVSLAVVVVTIVALIASIIIVYGFYSIIDKPEKSGGIADTHKPYKEVTLFKAPSSDMYVVEYDPNTTLEYSDIKGKVFYDRINDRIIYGDDLEELGDL